MRPPERETQIVLSSGERLWLPGKFASYRNYQLGLYERAVFALLPSIATNGMTVLDVGASVGLYTLTFSRLVGAAGTVFAFEADGVETHVTHVPELIREALGIFPKHHVGAPAAATNQNFLSVDGKYPLTVGIELRIDFANAESRMRGVRNFAIYHEL